MSGTEFRNAAIVVHVDHDKATFVDAMLKQSGVFSNHGEVADRVMDSGDLEREKGITILTENIATRRKGEGKNDGDLIIDVIDTPGHADFGGEVEHILSTADGVVLLIDSSEGSLPQTCFVLDEALAACMPMITMANEADHPDVCTDEVVEEAQDLLLELASILENPGAAKAAEYSLKLPVLYVSSRIGKVSTKNPGNGSLPESENLQLLFGVTAKVLPEPSVEIDTSLQIRVTNLDPSPFLGRISLIRIHKGRIRKEQQISQIHHDSEGNERIKSAKVAGPPRTVGMTRVPAQEAIAGDIAIIPGIDEVMIGDSLCDVEHLGPLPYILADEPVISVTIGMNTSSLTGQGGGDKLTARMIKTRLDQELTGDVSLRMPSTERLGAWEVQGRGEMALSALVGTMRREGLELAVGKPQVVAKTVDGKIQEPYEHLTINAPEEYLDVVTQLTTPRKGRMEHVGNQGTGWVCMELLIPSRGLIGFRTTFMTEAKGTGIANRYSTGYGEWADEIKGRPIGSLVASYIGQVTAYTLIQLSDRGTFFVESDDQAYEGMVVGQNPCDGDMDINITEEKKLINMCTASADVAVALEKAYELSLDEIMESCGTNGCAEVASEGIRVRKQILSTTDRACARSRARAVNKK